MTNLLSIRKYDPSFFVMHSFIQRPLRFVWEHQKRTKLKKHSRQVREKCVDTFTPGLCYGNPVFEHFTARCSSSMKVKSMTWNLQWHSCSPQLTRTLSKEWAVCMVTLEELQWAQVEELLAICLSNQTFVK